MNRNAVFLMTFVNFWEILYLLYAESPVLEGALFHLWP